MHTTSGRALLGFLAAISFGGVLILLASIPGESADPQLGAAPNNNVLQVVFALPESAVASVPSVDVLWNRSMRAVGAEVRGDEASLLTIQPAVPGRRQWIGSRALRFVPDRPFPRATQFTARVPAGVKDATGLALAAPFAWTFSTPPPGVVSVVKAADMNAVDPAGPIALIFNQPIDLARLTGAMRIEAAGRTHAFTATHPDSAAIRKVELLKRVPAGAELSAIALITPAEPFPAGSMLDLTIAPVPLATEGPLPLPETYRTQIAVRGPLVIEGVEAAEDGVALRLSTPADPDSIVQHVRISGPARRDSAPLVAYGGGQPTTRVHLGALLLPGKALRVQVGGGLRDRFGQMLGRDAVFDVTTPDRMPELRIVPMNATIEARGAKRIALAQGMNIEHLTVRAAAISADRAAELLRQPWMIGAEKNPFAGTKPVQRTHRLPSRRNVRHSVELNLDELLGRRTGGFVLMRVSSPDRVRLPWATEPDTLPNVYSVVQVTDLGLTAKVSAPDLLVWATSLHTADPLPDVELRILNATGSTVWRGRTGVDGLARAATPAPWQQAQQWTMIAKRGSDEAILLLDQDWELSPWAFNLPGDFSHARERADVFLFSDRELYRPGDTVSVKGIVRARGRRGLGPAPADSVILLVNGPRGDEIAIQHLAVSDFGTLTTTFTLPPGAPLGYYWGRVAPTEIARELDLRGNLNFRIEEFRPAPFAVDLTVSPADTAGGKRLVRGEPLRSQVRARTFYDAPIAGAPGNLVVRRSQSLGPPVPASDDDAELLAGFSFDDPLSEEPPWALVLQEPVRLDEHGEAALSTAIALDGIHTPQQLEVEVEVEDPGQRRVAATRSIDWYPAAIRLGVAAEPQVVSAGEPVRVKLAVTDLAGTAAEGTTVHVQWIERQWHTVRKPMVGGRIGYESEVVETVLDSAAVRSAGELANPAVAEFTPRTPGSYLVRARARDAAGRETRSLDFAYAAGPGYVPWSRDQGHELTLVPDRATYSPGDTASVLIQSPFPTARGLWTIEREGIHSATPFLAQSSAPILKIPLGPEAVPNLYVSVVLVRGTAAGAAAAPADTLRSGAPELAIGYANLAVKPESKKLDVRVEPPPGAGPGDSVSVRVTVAGALDRTAADAEVALFLVDEAVLRLLGTRTPDPFAFFYAPRGLGVMNAAKGLHVVETPDAQKEKGAPGGGGGQGGAFRRLFAATAVFLPDLRTGPDGVVQATFRLPDNLTTFRAMAVACDVSDRVGSGEAPLIVTRPLTLDPVLPRLARAGDRFDVGAVVSNRTAKKLKVRARVAAAGPGLEVDGDGTEKATIDAGKSRRLRFPVVANAAGQPALELTAETEGGGKGRLRDAVRLPLTIDEPKLTVVDAHYGRIAAADSPAVVPVLLDPRSVPRLSSVETDLSASSAGGLEDAVRYLLEYPHECLEQLDSRLIALAVAKEFSTELILPEWPRDRVVAEANATVSKIGELATYDGGFRQWPALVRPDPYLSAYTLLALIEARDAGVQVSGDRLREVAGYLKREIDSKRTEPEGQQKGRKGAARAERVQAGGRDAHQPILIRRFTDGDALAAMLLARENRRRSTSDLNGILAQADLERMHRHASDLGRDGKLFLATALNEMLRTDPRVGTLVGEVLNDVSLTGGSAFIAGEDGRFGTDATLTAIGLRTLEAVWPDHELSAPFARWLGQNRRRGYWRNTHGTAYALLAFRDIARREGGPGAAPIAGRAVMGSTVLVDKPLGGSEPPAVRMRWPLERIPGFKPGMPGDVRVERRPVAGTGGGGARPGDSGSAAGGARPLHYAVRAVSVRPAMQSEAHEAGLILIREVHAFDPAKPEHEGEPITRARAGDPVRIELSLVVPRAVTDVALTDPLPAGLEPIALDFQTTGRSLGLALAERESRAWEAIAESEGGRNTAGVAGVFPALEVERRDDRVVAYAPWIDAGIYRFEYLARAAVPGRFGVPPATAELMYDPEVNARTAAAEFEVVEKD